MTTLRIKDKNRAELVKAVVRQTNGRIFSVTAKRKSPKKYFVVGKILKGSDSKLGFIQVGRDGYQLSEGDKIYLNTNKNQKLLEAIKGSNFCELSEHTEHFMKLTCRTGVKKDLKGGDSTIKHKEDLISVNLTDGKGYRCFSAYNVLSIKGGGAEITFKEEDVLSCEVE